VRSIAGNAGIGHVLGVEQVRELACALDQARGRSRVVGAGVDGDYARCDIGRIRLLGGPVGRVAAGRQDEQIGCSRPDVVPAHAEGALPGRAEGALAARERDELGDPVARRVRRVDPLGDEHARPRQACDRGPHGVELSAHTGGTCAPAAGDAERIRDELDGLGDLVERARVESQRRHVERTELSARDGADRAEVLREDEVRLEQAQQRLVDDVEGAAALDGSSHGLVHLVGAQRAGVDSRPAGNREVEHLGRPVALVRARDQQVRAAELGHDLGGAGQERHDAHDR
jgi:hypothetical protein